jgi:hypothetical protein
LLLVSQYSRGVSVYSAVCTLYCGLFNPSHYSLLFLTSHPHFSTAFGTYSHFLYLNRCYILWYCWCFIILFSLPSFPKFHRIVLVLQICSTSEFVCDHVCFVYMFIFGSIFCRWEKTCSLCLSEPGLLHLKCPAVASIYLQTTWCHSLWLSKTPLYMYIYI